LQSSPAGQCKRVVNTMLPCRVSFVGARGEHHDCCSELARQARVCPYLAEDCEDQYLTERLRLMAADLAAKADDVPTERLRQVKPIGHLVNGAPLRPRPDGRHDRQGNRHCKYGQHKKHRHHRQHLASSEANASQRVRVSESRQHDGAKMSHVWAACHLP
jgi:hypothetical protein